jgi:hypothetical protein
MLLDVEWLKGDIEKMAMHFAIAQLVPVQGAAPRLCSVVP